MPDKSDPNSENKGQKQHEGIFIVDGGQLQISKLSISFNKKGGIISDPPELKLRFDVCPEWLEIAIEHLEANDLAAKDVQTALGESDNDAVELAMKKEFRSGMQSIVASCTALEAFYEIIKEISDIPDELTLKWRKNRIARYARIAETIKIAYNIKNETAGQLRGILKECFRFRDKAIHPNQEFIPPALHPEINRAVDTKFVFFRHYNAKEILRMILSVVHQLCNFEKIKNKKIQEYSEQLLTRLSPLVDIWESRYGKLHAAS